MNKPRTIEYIMGFITGMSIMLAIWACTNTSLQAGYDDVQKVQVVNGHWDPVKVTVIK